MAPPRGKRRPRIEPAGIRGRGPGWVSQEPPGEGSHAVTVVEALFELPKTAEPLTTDQTFDNGKVWPASAVSTWMDAVGGPRRQLHQSAAASAATIGSTRA